MPAFRPQSTELDKKVKQLQAELGVSYNEALNLLVSYAFDEITKSGKKIVLKPQELSHE